MRKVQGHSFFLIAVVLLAVSTLAISYFDSVGVELAPRNVDLAGTSKLPAVNQYCGLTDWTQHVLSRIPGAVRITGIADPQDSTYQMFIVVTEDVNNNTQWSLYNVGVDGRISNDDQVYSVSTFMGHWPPFYVRFITSDGPTSANRKLFWIELIGGVNIKSCDLPTCNNRVTEVSITGSLIGAGAPFLIVPSLTSDRIYIATMDAAGARTIISCSRNQAHTDWCRGSLANFNTHVAVIPSIPYVNDMIATRDNGFSYFDLGIQEEKFFSIGNDQVVILPAGSLLNGYFPSPPSPITPVGQGLGFLLRYNNVTNQIDLLLVDLNTGQSLGRIDIVVSSTSIVPWFIMVNSLGPTTFFGDIVWSATPPLAVFQSKLVGQPAKTVFTQIALTGSWIANVVPTASGNIVAMKLAQPPTFPQDGIVSFDCTP